MQDIWDLNVNVGILFARYLGFEYKFRHIFCKIFQIEVYFMKEIKRFLRFNLGFFLVQMLVYIFQEEKRKDFESQIGLEYQCEYFFPRKKD